MASKEIINCDNCGDDISPASTSYPRDDILVLECRNVAIHDQGPIFALAMTPLLRGKKHFCGFKCLGDWTAKKTSKGPWSASDEH